MKALRHGGVGNVERWTWDVEEVGVRAAGLPEMGD